MDKDVICFVLVFLGLIIPCLLFIKTNVLVQGLFDKKKIECNVKNKNTLKISMIVMFTLFLFIYGLNLFLPLEYRHTDSIGYLNSYIRPVLYSGRFFPLGHQEFNFITLERVGFIGLFTIPLLEAIVVIFCLYKLIPFDNKNFKLLMIVSVFISSLSIPFSNLIIPERNQLFFIVLFLFFSFESNEQWKIKLGLFFASVSLYYKEPTFIIYLAFSLSMLTLKIYTRSVNYKHLLNIKYWYKKMPIELYLIIMCMLYVISYIVMQSLQANDGLYNQGKSYQEYFNEVFSINGLFEYPFLLLSMIMLIMFFIKGLDSECMAKAFILYCGSNAYAFGLFILKMPIEHYYFNASNLLIILSSCYLIIGFLDDVNETVKIK